MHRTCSKINSQKITCLTDKEAGELWRLSRLYFREVKKCKQAKAYLAGCVMLGSALEVLLLLMVDCYIDEVEKIGVTSLKGKKSKSILAWDLANLLKAAKAAKWLPAALNLDDDWDSRKARIGDYAEIVRMVRNLVHPARYVRDHFNSRITAKHLQRQFEIVILCRDWLLEHTNRSLLKQMEDDIGPSIK